MKDLPQIFYDKLKKIYSKDEYELVLKWFKIDKRPVSFRLNTILWTLNDLKELDEKNILYSKIDFLHNWYILDKKYKEKDLWETQIFKTWKIYLQSISSHIPSFFLDLKKDDKVLDTTAAPGWKTSQIRAIIENTWEIIAVDNNAIRIDKLKHTINKQWVKNTQVVKNDATRLHNFYKKEYFDVILADLPCSAEWRINLNIEKTFWFWKEDISLKNASVQKQILLSIIPLLKKWWNLVYSTCTLSKEENEDVVKFILSNFQDMQLSTISLNMPNVRKWIDNLWLRILPNEIQEWFFIAKFIKKW